MEDSFFKLFEFGVLSNFIEMNIYIFPVDLYLCLEYFIPFTLCFYCDFLFFLKLYIFRHPFLSFRILLHVEDVLVVLNHGRFLVLQVCVWVTLQTKRF